MFTAGHIMRTIFSITLVVAVAAVLALPLSAQQQPRVDPPIAQAPATAASQTPPKGDPKATEVWEPVPPVVTPGKMNADAPSDAVVLFDGSNLNEWVNVKDK